MYASDYTSSSGGSSKLKIQKLTADGDVIGFNYMVECDSTSGVLTATLPPSTAETVGQSIIIKKMDNSNNVIIIKANGTETINGSTNLIYLYNINESVMIVSSEIGKSNLAIDGRNSSGYAPSYLKVTRGTTVAVTSNANLIFPTLEDSQGGNIVYTSSTGIVTLKANIKYRLRCAVNMITYSSDNAYAELEFYNITKAQLVGTSGASSPYSRTVNEDKILEVEYTFTPNVDTQIAPRLLDSLNISTISFSWLEVEELSKPATVLNTVDYLYGTIPSTVVSTSSVVIPITSVTGNINISGNMINLLTGKTYEIMISERLTNGGVGYAINSYLYNITNSSVLASTSLAPPVWDGNNDMPNNNIIYTMTPSVNTQIQLRADNFGGGTPSISGSFKITQIGSTAQTVNTIGITGEIKSYAGMTAPNSWLLCQGQVVSRTDYLNLYSVIGTTYGTGDGSGNTFNVPDLRGRTPIGVGQSTFSTSFASTAVNVTTNAITIASNTSLYTGRQVLYTCVGTPPAGLVNNTNYYIIVNSTTEIRLASTLVNSIAMVAVAIDITSQGSGTSTISFSGANRALGEFGGEDSHTITQPESPAHVHTGTVGAGGSQQMWRTGSESAPNPGSYGFTTSSVGGNVAHNLVSPYLTLNYIIKC